MQEWKAQREEADERARPTRRGFLQAAIGTTAVLTGLSVGYVGVGLLPKAIKTPENAPPQVGDILVYAIGARMNQPTGVWWPGSTSSRWYTTSSVAGCSSRWLGWSYKGSHVRTDLGALRRGPERPNRPCRPSR